MEKFSCSIDKGKRFEKGPCLYEKHKTTEGNPTCPECDYYKSYLIPGSHLIPTEIETPGPYNKSPQKKYKKKNSQRFDEAAIEMEKIKQKGSAGYTGYEREVVSYSYKFTKEERDDLSEHLEKFDNQKVKDFIDHLGIDLNMAYWVITRPDPKGQRSKLQKIINSLNKANENLFKILSHKGNFFQILPPRHVDFIMEYLTTNKHPRPETNARIRCLSMTIYPLLKEMIEILESALKIEKTPRHCPIADKYGLRFCIEKRFEEYFRPVKPDSVLADGLIEFCFKAIGLKQFDYSRASKFSLKKLNKF